MFRFFLVYRVVGRVTHIDNDILLNTKRCRGTRSFRIYQIRL